MGVLYDWALESEIRGSRLLRSPRLHPCFSAFIGVRYAQNLLVRFNVELLWICCRFSIYCTAYSCGRVKPEFHDADTETDTDTDILARMSVSVSWNASLKKQIHIKLNQRSLSMIGGFKSPMERPWLPIGRCRWIFHCRYSVNLWSEAYRPTVLLCCLFAVFSVQTSLGPLHRQHLLA